MHLRRGSEPFILPVILRLCHFLARILKKNVQPTSGGSSISQQAATEVFSRTINEQCFKSKITSETEISLSLRFSLQHDKSFEPHMIKCIYWIPCIIYAFFVYVLKNRREVFQYPKSTYDSPSRAPALRTPFVCCVACLNKIQYQIGFHLYNATHLLF